MTPRSALPTIVLAGFIVALLAVAATVHLALREMTRLNADVVARYETSVALEGLGTLLSDLLDAETGQRGYLLTGEAEYLAPYRDGVLRIATDTSQLGRLAAGDSALARGLTAMRPLIAQKLQLLDTTVRLRQGGRSREALTILDSDVGNRIMDSIRREVTLTGEALRRSLDARSRQVVAGTEGVKGTILNGALLAGVVIVAAGALTLHQLTSRVRTERALGASEERLRHALDAAGMGMFDWDVRSDQAHGTDTYFRLVGLAPSHRMPSEAEWLARVHPDDRERAAREVREALGGAPYDTEYRVVLPDGTTRWVSSKGKLFFDPHGSAYRMIGAMADITGRREAEEEMRRSERRLFHILDSLPVGIFVLDAAGRPYYANRLSQEILGNAAVPDVHVAELPATYQAYLAGTDQLYPADRQPIAAALQGHPAYAQDIAIRRPDKTVPIEVWAAPIHDGEGRLEFAVAAFNDITARRDAEERIAALNAELANQVAELEAVNKELETFSYSVSHDLRAPLRAIDGFSRMLVEDHGEGLDQEAHGLLAVVRDSSRQMGRLIDDLLKFSRLSRQGLGAAPVDMTALAQSVLQELMHGGGSTVDVTIQPLPAARGDAALLRQVWANYLGNALKYSRGRPNPRVEIAGRREGAEHVFAVRDNGVGFDMAYAGKLFGVFQRLHGSEEFEGTGVGLAIVQRIVHRHGGRVWAESEQDHGATFYFSLPAEGGKER